MSWASDWMHRVLVRGGLAIERGRQLNRQEAEDHAAGRRESGPLLILWTFALLMGCGSLVMLVVVALNWQKHEPAALLLFLAAAAPGFFLVWYAVRATRKHVREMERRR